MKVLTMSDVRKNFASVLDAVIDDAEETVIPRGGGKAVVLVSLDEWNSMKETLHLLSTPANARRLLASIEAFERGEEIRHLPAEPDEPQNAA